MLQIPELLAPAGDLERLRYAINYGADAVYLAGRRFGMRSAAQKQRGIPSRRASAAPRAARPVRADRMQAARRAARSCVSCSKAPLSVWFSVFPLSTTIT